MFDGKNFGYIAIGDMIVFRALTGQETDIMRMPPDVDSHAVARCLNVQLDSTIQLVQTTSAYKL